MHDVALGTDEWLGARLGVDCWTMSIDEDAPARDLRGIPGGFVSAKVDLTHPHAAPWVARLHAAGFSLIAVEVAFAGELLDTVCGATPLQAVRTALADDEPALRGVAARSFSADRFHRDPRVPNAVADQIKSDWVGGFFTGSRGTRMLVVDTEAGHAGAFVQLIDTEDAVVVDLIAVDAPLRGRGVGRALLAAATAGGIRVAVRVGTQLDNLASLRLYSNCGLSITSSRYVLHLHGSSS